MPCKHKFQAYLALDKVTFAPSRLFVGTFNPGWPALNYAEWFYGRTRNNYFWDILPETLGWPGLRKQGPEHWKNFCSTQRIALTDLISSVVDANELNPFHQQWLGNYSDQILSTKFRQFEFTDIVGILQKHETIREVYLTRTASSIFWQRLWKPVQDYCADNRLYCAELVTPSKGARFSMTRGSNIPIHDFTLRDWKSKIRPSQTDQAPFIE